MAQSPSDRADETNVVRRSISGERKTLYYLGMAISVVGILMFLSTFVTFLWHFGDFSNFESRARSDGLRAVGGVVLVIVGAVVSNIGARGAAGSGLKLDPEQARKDVEPWSRMSGGVLKDVFDEAGIRIGADRTKPELPFDEKLRRLHALFQDGIINEAEYLREKQELLDQN